jgi:Holliday junction resolvase RusA-like endonuclease
VSEFGLNRDEQIRALKRQLGVSDEQARAIVAGATIASADRLPAQEPMPTIFPLELIVPWSALVSDDRKYAPALRMGSPVILLTEKYRKAKQAAEAIARQAVLGAPASIPLQLHARVWVPDNRPGHDVANFAKCCHDAFEDLVYTRDEWLHDVRWTRAGVDVDRPRAEIRITPFLGIA